MCRKLCAVVLDSVGREVIVEQPVEFDADGWPQHGADVTVKAGEQVRPAHARSRVLIISFSG